MKKKILVILFLFFLILGNIGGVKTYADTIPFGLITTELDHEPNDYFTNDSYLFGNGIDDMDNFSNKNGSITGIIEQEDDIDIYKFNLFSDCQVSFRLSMLDDSQEDFFEYDFILYKQKNEINTYEENVIEIIETQQPGAVDYYGGLLTAGTYYIRIFGRYGDYSYRHSYKLYYNVSIETKHNLDITNYQIANPNSYLIWSSDFNFLDTKKMINVAGIQIGENIHVNTLSHEVMDHFYDLNGFPNLSFYIWGNQLRTDLYNSAQQILTQLYLQRDQYNRENEQVLINTQKVNDTKLFCTVINISGQILFSIDIDFNLLISALIFLGIINIGEMNSFIPISDLITSLSVICAALSVDDETPETQVVALTQTSKVERINKKFFLTNTFTAFETDITNSSRLIGKTLKDILGYTNTLTNIHTNIYGDIYYPLDLSLFV